jgi:hypothetical protein
MGKSKYFSVENICFLLKNFFVFYKNVREEKKKKGCLYLGKFRKKDGRLEEYKIVITI